MIFGDKYILMNNFFWCKKIFGKTNFGYIFFNFLFSIEITLPCCLVKTVTTVTTQ